jgi:hypothetical protein
MRVVILLLAILALSAFIGCQAKPMVVSESQPGLEGIKVHGDWTIKVTNPDGSLATRKQFANEFVGQHIVAYLLSQDADMGRRLSLRIDDGSTGQSQEAKCKESVGAILPYSQHVWANTIHAPNSDGSYYNSLWNGTCTLEITGDGPKFLTRVGTKFFKADYDAIPKYQGNDQPFGDLSIKVLDESIEVWDGQAISATVILSVE